MIPVRGLLLSCLVIALHTPAARADGTGLIGWGKTLYNPTCCFACRIVIGKQQLRCTPVESTGNYGTNHNPVATPPGCFVEDPAFLKTVALCINTYCPLSDCPPASVIDDYWASHLGTGTLGDPQYVPVMSYNEALIAARADEFRATFSTNSTVETSHDHVDAESDSDMESEMSLFNVSSPLPAAAGGRDPLNVTSFVDPKAWQMQYNYLSNFETNEAGHSTMT